MKTTVNAMLSFGLISVPVGVASFASKKETRMTTLHRDCGQRVSHVKKCNHHGVELIDSDIVRAVEVAKGQYVTIEAEELEQFTSERNKTIQLKKFVPRVEVEDFIEKRYHLAPSVVAEGYRLLWRAMDVRGVVGIGQAALWGKESPIAVMSAEDGLMLAVLFCADEMNDPSEMRPITHAGTDADQEKMAVELVKTLEGEFSAEEDLISASRNAVEAFIESKVAGREPAPLVGFDAPAVTPDIGDALRLSIAAAKSDKPKRSRKKVSA